MKRGLLLAVATMLLALLACSCSAGGHGAVGAPIITHQNPNKPISFGAPPPGNPAIGDVLYTTTGQWSGSPTGFSYLWEDCDSNGNNCSTAAGSPTNTQRYQVVAGDEGSTIRVAVTASYSGLPNATAVSAQTGEVATLVGTAAAPTPTCTTTVSVNGNVSSAVAAASNGATVCMANGSWSGVSLSNASSNTVTLAAQTPGSVTVDGMSLAANISHLTVQGLTVDKGNTVGPGVGINSGTLSSDTFQYNTIQNVEGGHTGAALFVSANATLSGVSYLYNQETNTGQCFELEGGQTNTTFSHNVCDAIGNGNPSGQDTHWTQADGQANSGCQNGLTMDNNAFVGPPNAAAFLNGSHLNLLHSCGSSITVENNIIFETDSVSQNVLLGDDGDITNPNVSNNLIIEVFDATNVVNGTRSIDMSGDFSTSGRTAENDTIVGDNHNQDINAGIFGSDTTENDIAVQVGNAGGGAFNSVGTTSGNVSDDGTGGGITAWTPCWQNTTWTPNNGSPWDPPPSNYYKPQTTGTGVGGCTANHSVTSAAGYQGVIGP